MSSNSPNFLNHSTILTRLWWLMPFFWHLLYEKGALALRWTECSKCLSLFLCSIVFEILVSLFSTKEMWLRFSPWSGGALWYRPQLLLYFGCARCPPLDSRYNLPSLFSLRFFQFVLDCVLLWFLGETLIFFCLAAPNEPKITRIPEVSTYIQTSNIPVLFIYLGLINVLKKLYLSL